MHDVAIQHNIFLAFKAELSGFLGADFTIVFHIVSKTNGFRTYEALLEVRVNDTCRRWRLGALGNGPGAGFLGTDSEIGYQMQQVIACPDNPVQTRLFKANGIEIILLVSQWQNRDFAFNFGRYDNRNRILQFGAREHALREFITLVGSRFLNIANIQHRL